MIKLDFPNQHFLQGLERYKHQLDFLQLFESNTKKYFMLKWARRHGKSTMVFNILIQKCLENEKSRYAFIFTTYQAAKNIITKDPDMLSMLPEQEYDGQIWKLNKADLTIEFFNGSILQMYGADKPQSLRGFNAKGVAIDEWSQHRSDTVWTEIVEPVLTNNGGFCIFIYTPKGVNHASEMYNGILNNSYGEEWYCSTITAEQSKLISAEELEKARQRIGDLLYRQEYLCEDLADDDLVIIPQIKVNALESIDKHQKYLKRVVSIDPALEGGDECCCYYMENSQVVASETINSDDTMKIGAIAMQFMDKHKCKNVVVDSIGLGKGVFDFLRGFNRLNVINFDSRKKSIDSDRFGNLKAEAWFQTRKMVEQGKIPPLYDKELKKQLSATRYRYSGARMRIFCEEKSVTKARLGRSPDKADAFVMGVWAFDRLPDENKQNMISRIDKNRLDRRRGTTPTNWAAG
jgi:hypothetical protein